MTLVNLKVQFHDCIEVVHVLLTDTVWPALQSLPESVDPKVSLIATVVCIVASFILMYYLNNGRVARDKAERLARRRAKQALVRASNKKKGMSSDNGRNETAVGSNADGVVAVVNEKIRVEAEKTKANEHVVVNREDKAAARPRREHEREMPSKLAVVADIAEYGGIQLDGEAMGVSPAAAEEEMARLEAETALQVAEEIRAQEVFQAAEKGRLAAERAAKEMMVRLDADRNHFEAEKEKARLEEERGRLEAARAANEVSRRQEADRLAEELTKRIEIESSQLEAKKNGEEERIRLETMAEEERERLETRRAAEKEKDNLAAVQAAEEERVRLEAQKVANEVQARLEAEAVAVEKTAKLENQNAAAELKARLEPEQAALEEKVRLAAQKEVDDIKARLDAERAAQEETDRLEAERVAALEHARLEAQKTAEEEVKRLERAEEAERKRSEAEREAEEEKVRLAAQKEVDDIKARLDAERAAQEETDRLEAERVAAVEHALLEAQKAAEEEVKRLERAEEAERKRLEAEREAEEEKVRLAAQKEVDDIKARLDAERAAQEETDRLEAERVAAKEKARLATEYVRQKEAELAAEEVRLLDHARKAAAMRMGSIQGVGGNELSTSPSIAAEISGVSIVPVKDDVVTLQPYAPGVPMTPPPGNTTEVPRSNKRINLVNDAVSRARSAATSVNVTIIRCTDECGWPGLFRGDHRSSVAHGFGCWVQDKFLENSRLGYAIRKYSGEWKDGKFNGLGEMSISYEDEDTIVKDIYWGEFDAGRYHGWGKKVYSSGAIYTGEWAHGTRNGFGRFISAEGVEYEGSWLDGMRHGSGHEEYPDGKCNSGSFFNDSFNG